MVEKEKSIKKNIIYNLIYTGGNFLFPLLTSMYVSRILFDSGVGAVAYAQNIISYFLALATLGIPSYGIKAIGRVKNDQFLRNKIFSELLVINFITTSFSVLCFVIFFLFFNSNNGSNSLILVCGTSLFLNYINVDWFYQGIEEYAYITNRSLIIKFLSLIAIFLFVKSKNDLIIYALISSLALAANNVFNIFKLKSYVKFKYKKLSLTSHFSTLLVLAISVFLSTLYSKIDITMLGMVSDEVVGLYAYSHKIPEMFIMGMNAITAVFLPRLSYYYNYDKERFFSLIKKGIDVVSFFSFPFCIICFAFSKEILTILFGSEFGKAEISLQIFSVIIIIKSFGNLLCYQLALSTNNEHKRLISYSLGTLINICLNIILIPKYSLNGAAIASLISEFFVNFIQYNQIKKVVNLNLDKRPIIVGIISSGLLLLFIIIFKPLVDCGNILHVIVLGIISSVFYLIINIIIKSDFTTMLIRNLRVRN